MATQDPVRDAVATAEDRASAPDEVRRALDALLVLDPQAGAATAFGILSREPRIKPSSRIVLDPDGLLLRRWHQRVAAARALLASPTLARVYDELYDELADSAELSHDALRGALVVAADLTVEQRARLARLAESPLR